MPRPPETPLESRRDPSPPCGGSRPRRHATLPLAVVAALASPLAAPTPAPGPATIDAAPVDAAPVGAAPVTGSAGTSGVAPVVPRTSAAPLPAAVRAQTAPTYRVRNGDTVSHIAARTGSSVRALIAANGLRPDGFLRVGQVITLPRGAAASAGAPADASRYVVRPGDTLSHLAARLGTSVAALRAANPGLDARGTIVAGQTLTLPGATAPAPSRATGTGRSHTVRPGDTLTHVAARYGTTVAALRAANPGLGTRGTIIAGRTLALPAAARRVPSTFAGRTYPPGTVAAAQANADALARRAVPGRAEMQRIVAETARAHGVDPALAQAVAFQESGFDHRVVSPANAIGVMQVIPSSGRWASDLAGRRLDLLDPRDNATAGVLVLRALLRSTGDRATALAGYYQGLSSVRRNGQYADTRRYVANVQTLAARFR